MPEIVATPEPDLARVLLEVSGGAPGEVFYIFRRDADGVDIVRDTSEGSAGYPQITPLRRNLARNPVPVGTAHWTSSGGSLTAGVDGGPMLLGMNAAATLAVAYEGANGTAHPVTPGETVHASATVRPNLPGAWNVQARLEWSVTGATWTAFPYQVVTGSGPSAVVPIDVSAVMPATAAYARLNLTVRRMSARNYLPDGSWEKGLTVWENTPNLEVSATTDWATDGIQSVIATMVGTPADAYVGIPGATIVSPEYLGPLVVGEWLGWGGDVYSPGATRGFAARFVFTNAAGATVGTSPYGAFVGSGGRAVVSAQVPTGAVRAFIRLHLYGTATGTGFLPAGGSIRTDSWALVRAADSAAALAAAGTYTPPWDLVPNALEISSVLFESSAGGMVVGGPYFPPQAPGREVTCTWDGARNASRSRQWDDGVPVRTNLAINPRGVGTVVGDHVPTFAMYVAGVGETGTTSIVTASDGPLLPDGTRPASYVRRTIATPKTSGSTGFLTSSGASYRSPATGVAGDTASTALYVRFSAATDPGAVHRTVRLRTQQFAGGVTGALADSATVALPMNGWVRVDSTLTAAAAFDALGWWLYSTSGSNLPAGSTLDIVCVDIETGPVAPYFDGDTPPSGALRASSWEGAANASSSVWGSYAVAPIYDYEATQGTVVEYLLTDPDGNVQATVNVTLPLWGTWLKSPGRPYRNVRCYFGSMPRVDAPLPREVYDVDGAGQVVVYSSLRSADRAPSLRLVTQTLEQLEGMRLLLSDGATLMLDTPPSWNIGMRYLSAGDVGRERPLATSEGFGNLEATARMWELADVVTVESPQGVTTTDPGRTYASLPVLFATYTAIPATTATYEELATGVPS